MKGSNQIARRTTTSQVAQVQYGGSPFAVAMGTPEIRSIVDNAIRDPKRSASFVSTLISAVNGSEQLRQCNPTSIVSAALRGEAMSLSLALGQYSIVPYRDTANFQISYKGLAQLATRSGQYENFGVFDVRDGELIGRDMMTRDPIIEWKDDEERESLKIIGYYGFYKLQNGFFKSIYWSHEKILKHADRYSSAFNLDEYRKIMSGEKKPTKGVSPWYDLPDSEAHMKMCKKTVLIQLLSDGTAPLSIEMANIFEAEKVMDKGIAISADDPVIAQANSVQAVVVDADTGEIIEEKKARKKSSKVPTTTVKEVVDDVFADAFIDNEDTLDDYEEQIEMNI